MSNYNELERVLFTWYEQARASNIPVDENIFREKTLEIAVINDMDIFPTSNGWIYFLKFAMVQYPGNYTAKDIHFVLSAWYEVTSSAIQNCFVKCGYVRKNHEECSTEGQENNDDKADEEWLRVAEDVSGEKLSDYISIDQNVATCSTQSIEEICDDAKNKNNGEEAEDTVLADEAEPTPVPSLSEAITAFEIVRTFIYAHGIIEKDPKNIINLKNLLFNFKK
ncbi:hypothetical protein NPIL_381651 [Nephila pilipes]|uniref:HTH CENPB-type domain-containing protein n=1 Tax=Nephila pilipes TaxID=299642 RepID=A0A8X6UK99_NEPPI|nr:hypothetical protein NPIL_381651 [Nephila pilipes]